MYLGLRMAHFFFFVLNGGGGGLEDFENKIARAQAGKQISCRVQTYVNPL